MATLRVFGGVSRSPGMSEIGHSNDSIMISWNAVAKDKKVRLDSEFDIMMSIRLDESIPMPLRFDAM
ncbi:hypothetical protein M378DRAFT_859529 [Amanita muscaria Koide BX008]|uniref:Uncharacterized protein n=1 Tax=Amanita muscaria (strain Koide BX008) TaxID=946122 RepID=A0A0C2T416_AMAMK|nr:hypothetical protein M378DRAFT_859529 [Amanita muscaria Koide BX008]